MIITDIYWTFCRGGSPEVYTELNSQISQSLNYERKKENKNFLFGRNIQILILLKCSSDRKCPRHGQAQVITLYKKGDRNNIMIQTSRECHIPQKLQLNLHTVLYCESFLNLFYFFISQVNYTNNVRSL